MALLAQPGTMPGVLAQPAGAQPPVYARPAQQPTPVQSQVYARPPQVQSAPAQMTNLPNHSMLAALGLPTNTIKPYKPAAAPAPMANGLPTLYEGASTGPPMASQLTLRAQAYPMPAVATPSKVFYNMDPRAPPDPKQQLPDSPAQSEAKMAIFDFDNTLTQEMVYHDLQHLYRVQTEPTLAMAQAQSDEWWIAEFGGPARIRMLDTCLGKLRSMGVKCYVCSMNVAEIIEHAFCRVKIDHHFRNDAGLMRIVPKIPGYDKGKRVQMVLDKHSAEPSKAIFADDIPQNCAKVENEVQGIMTVNCGRKGLNEQEFNNIITKFASGGEIPIFQVNELKSQQSVMIMAGDTPDAKPKKKRRSRKKRWCGCCG